MVNKHKGRIIFLGGNYFIRSENESNPVNGYAKLVTTFHQSVNIGHAAVCGRRAVDYREDLSAFFLRAQGCG